MDAFETIEYRGFEIKLYQDEDPMNPRLEHDNMGIMACYHPNYELGDKAFHKCRSSEEVMELALAEVIGGDKASAIQNGCQDFIGKAVFIMRKLCPVILPLYILDHSGIWMKTGCFCEDPGGWDTSLVGFIFLTKNKVKEEYGDDKEAVDKAAKYIEGEVKEYSAYLSGDVFGYVIEPSDRNHSIECDDSCWGFIGDDRDYAVGEAKGSIDYTIKEYREKCKATHLEKKELDHFMNFAWAL